MGIVEEHTKITTSSGGLLTSLLSRAKDYEFLNSVFLSICCAKTPDAIVKKLKNESLFRYHVQMKRTGIKIFFRPEYLVAAYPDWQYGRSRFICSNGVYELYWTDDRGLS